MKKALFIDKAQQQLLDEKGILKTAFSDPATIKQLRDIFERLHPVRNSTMNEAYYFSIFNNSSHYMRQIYDEFIPVLKPRLDKLFTNYKVLAVMVQVKGTGANSKVSLHQDLTMVDESKYNFVNVWIPLMDSTAENGAISALHGSHRAFRSFRAHTIDDYAFAEVEDFVKQNAVLYPAVAGEALVFDLAAIHFSAPNTTAEPRISIAVSVVDADAPVQIGFHDKLHADNDIEVYNVPDNFWFLYNNFTTERTERPSFGTYSHTLKDAVVRNYNRADFIARYFATQKGFTSFLKYKYYKLKLLFKKK